METILAVTKDELIECPKCGCVGDAMVHSPRTKTVQDIDCRLRLVYFRWYCNSCNKFFSDPAVLEISPTKRRFTKRFIDHMIRAKLQMSLGEWSDTIRDQYDVEVPVSTLHDWLVDA